MFSTHSQAHSPKFGHDGSGSFHSSSGRGGGNSAATSPYAHSIHSMASPTGSHSPQYAQHAQYAATAAPPPSIWGPQASSSPIGGIGVNGGADFDPESGGVYGMHAPVTSYGGNPDSGFFASGPADVANDIEGGSTGYSVFLPEDAKSDPNFAADGFGQQGDNSSRAAHVEEGALHPHTDSAKSPMNTAGNANSGDFYQTAPAESADDPEAGNARSNVDNATASGLEGSWAEAGTSNDAEQQQQQQWAEQQQQQSAAAGEESAIEYSVRLVSSFAYTVLAVVLLICSAIERHML